MVQTASQMPEHCRMGMLARKQQTFRRCCSHVCGSGCVHCRTIKLRITEISQAQTSSYHNFDSSSGLLQIPFVMLLQAGI